MGQIFGGQLAARCMGAGARAMPELSPHSLHLMFLSAGDADQPVLFRTAPVRAGRSVSVARVEAIQGDHLLATSVVSCHCEESSEQHGVAVPTVPGPSGCHPLDLSSMGGTSAAWSTVEARHVEAALGAEPTLRMWLRWNASLEDAVAHVSALVWMTDLASSGRLVSRLRLRRCGSARGPPWTTASGCTALLAQTNGCCQRLSAWYVPAPDRSRMRDYSICLGA